MLAEVLDQFAAEAAPPSPPAARVKTASIKPKLVAVKSDAPAILSAIATAALDPAVSVEKMDLMRSMYREALADASRRAFTVAMNAAQAAMSPIAANALNDDFDSQYATYAALDAVMRPIYTGLGFTVSFTTEPSDLKQHQRVVIILDHVEGHQETRRADFPADGLGEGGEFEQTLIHATASAFTYAQRYMLALAFNIAIAKDRDGNAIARPAEAITADQVTRLANLIDRTGGDEPGLLALLGVRDLAAIPSDKFDHAMWLVQNRKAA